MSEENQEKSSKSLVNFLLNGNNYLTWARAVKLALGGQSKIQYIYGRSETEEEPLPENATDAEKLKAQKDKKKNDEDWEVNDLRVMSQILNSIEPKLYGIFAYTNNSKELWDSIYEMYGDANNSSRVFELQQDISNLKQSSDQPFLEHFGVFKQKWEELRQYRPTANSVMEYIKREQQDQIFGLLASLTPDFEDVRREILMRPELPSLNAVCATIQREETRRRVMGPKVNTSPNDESYAHFTKSNNNNYNSGNWNKGKSKKNEQFFCEHCKKNGHTKDRCWVLYPHLKPAKNRPKEANLTTVPDGNGGVQHMLEQITKQIDFLMKRCNNDDSANGASHAVQQSGTTFAASFVSFPKIIVDSGATDNMFTSRNLLTTMQPETKYPHVTVANGITVPTKGTGTTQIFSKDINVTVVPDLKANLLSISKCTNQLDCNVLFTPRKWSFRTENQGGRLVKVDW